MSWRGAWLGSMLGLDRGVLRRSVGLVVLSAAVLAVLISIALGYLALSLFFALHDRFTSAESAAIVALVALGLSPAVVAIMANARRKARREAATLLQAETIARLAPPAFSLVARHGGVASMIAVAGIAYLMARRR